MMQHGPKILEETDAAQQIVANPRPLMIVDTCNFGNIISLALSGKSKAIQNTLSCLHDGLAKQLFYLVVPQQVYREFTRPGQFVSSVIENLDKQIQGWNAAVQTYNNICATPNLWTAKNAYCLFDIEAAKQLFDELVEISKQFLNQAIVVKASSRAQQWAYQREIDRKRPARQGKDSFGDCEICGTTLSFLETLRKLNYSELSIFVSENKEDFASNNELHSDLQAEFAHVALAYCQTIPKAYGEIWQQHNQSVRGQKA